MEFQVWGLVSLLAFYAVVFMFGIIASWKLRKSNQQKESEDVMLAGRDLGMVIGLFSMTATWVDGGYLNGASESVYGKGILWCQGPLGYSLSLIVSGLFYAKKMRDAGYVTMLDPFYEKYGNWTALFYIPSLLGDLFATGAILSALGATVGTVIGLDVYTSIISSGAIATFYTLFGGMYSVTYTDVVELICMFVGVWLCVPFCLMNKAVGPLSEVDMWGEIPTREIGTYSDGFLLLILGGVPWQCYFQRVLASRTSRTAVIVSCIAGVWCIILAIPPVIIGTVALATNWTDTTYGHVPESEREKTMILPLCLLHLTPRVVAYIGLGAVASAVMSSADANVLSSSSQFARNIYKNIFRPQASEREIVWILRLSMIVIGALATTISLTVDSIYSLWYLAGDTVYVILFPQLTSLLYFKQYCNRFGAVSAFFVSIILRLLGGEPVLHLPAVLKYPYYDEELKEQLFPFKTLAMLVGFATLIGGSILSDKFLAYYHHRKASISDSTLDARTLKQDEVPSYGSNGALRMEVIKGYENRAFD